MLMQRLTLCGHLALQLTSGHQQHMNVVTFMPMTIFLCKHRGVDCHQPLNEQHSHSSCVLNETGWEERQNLRKSTLISMALFFELLPGIKRLKKGRGLASPTLFWIKSQSSFTYPGHLF